MRLGNSLVQYGAVAVIVHWVMAVLLIGLLALGLYMVTLPVSLEKLKLYGWHKEYGMLALFLAVFRVFWRLGSITPHLALPTLEKVAARLVHWAFYGFMFALPLTGWLMSSSAGLPVSFFGLVVLPDLVAPNEHYMNLYKDLHKWLGYALIATIALHTAAALKHHFINKDNILRRMLSW